MSRGRADVTVMGGGAFGLAIAWACARRGARVELRETRRIGAGASGGLVGALAPHAPDGWTEVKAFQLQALLMAEGWWADVAAAGGGDPGYARTGRVQPLADAAAIARAEARAAEAASRWGPAARWEVRLAEAVPGLGCASPSGRVVFDTLSARLHPRWACAALAAALVARGGRVIEGSDSPEGDGPVIWATGWEGLAALSADLGRTVGAGVKGQALLLDHDASHAPQLSAPGLHVVPHADGTTAIGSTSETDFAAPETTDAHLDAVLARAVALCPDLAGAPVMARWAGVRPRARSRSPVLGPWPGRPGRYLANGGFKIGLALAPLVGEMMADLVLEGRDTIPAAFRPEAL
jgi:glycine/D-amino acid oxidase-like deaminating enzyme